MNMQDQTRPLLEYDGTTGELCKIFFTNLLFNVLTLGFYRFWGTTKLRRYVWSHMRFQDERFEYTGTGAELFKGFSLACMVIGGAWLAAHLGQSILLLATHSKLIAALPAFALFLLLAVLKASARYGAERYRLSRTMWRGIRGGMTGSAIGYGVRATLYFALCVVSLFQLVPWTSMRLAERRISTARFGSAEFRFEGRAAKVYGAYLLTALGYAVLLGVAFALFLKPMYHALHDMRLTHAKHLPIAFWGNLLGTYVSFVAGAWLVKSLYLVAMARHIAGNTSFGGMLSLSSTISVSGWIKLMGGNFLLLIVTLGLGYPLALQRSLRYLSDNLHAQGYVDPAALNQSTLREPTMGEGMLNLLDHGGAL
jgi:uncharacterized membrane protein YjgN (DUF898 family)